MSKGRTMAMPSNLTPNMVRVIEATLEGALQDNITSIARKAHVRRACIYEWLNPEHRCFSPAFREKWDGLFDIIVKDTVPIAMAALKRKAAKGDVTAIKLLLELAKKYQPSWLKVEGDGASLEALVLASHLKAPVQRVGGPEVIDVTPESVTTPAGEGGETAGKGGEAGGMVPSPPEPTPLEAPPAPGPEPAPVEANKRRGSNGKAKRRRGP